MILNFDARIENQIEGFVGRKWVFEAVNEWLTDNQSKRFFIIQAEPGSGKTAIAAQLVQFSQGSIAPPDNCANLSAGFLSGIHFCNRADSTFLDPLMFVNSIAMQLAERDSLFAGALVTTGGNRVIHTQQNIGTAEAGATIIGTQVQYIERLDLGGLSAENAFNLTG